MILVYCKNNDSKTTVPYGTTLLEYAKQENVTLEYPLLGALVNNKTRDITYKIHKPATIQFFDITSPYGHDFYMRTLYFILYKAVKDLIPESTLKILHSISNGKYCELDNLNGELTSVLVEKLKSKMQELIDKNIPIERMEMLTAEAIEEFKKHGLDDKFQLLRYRNRIFTSVFKMENTINYYYGYLLPSTGYIYLFDLELYESGLLLKIPSRKHPTTLSPTRKSEKLFSIYKEYKAWGNSIGVPYVSNLNKKVVDHEVQDTILITEAFHEKLISQIADQIHQKGSRMVLISGPSSSGKTTTCKRISVQLSILGYHPVQISVDDFFVEREQTPLDAQGKYDFEALEAIDLELFNKTLSQLLEGKEVELPVFNFTIGSKEWKGHKIQLQKNSVMVIEGIHCLNPKLTEQIANDTKFKIFVSALTSISIDQQNPIPTTDNRLVRRI
ncbi:MAG: nucleoside kinase, partial [Bacteroidales bacterium]